jgi:hypothetical protein
VPQLQPVPIAPPPGVVLTETDKVAVGRFTGSSMCRFLRGRLQKRGGWTRLTSVATLGTPRASLPWRDNSGNAYFGVGTFEKLYVYDPSWIQNDITPFRVGASGPVTLGNNPLTTQSGTPIITVNFPGHGAGIGDFVYIAGATAVGGITPNIAGAQVTSVIDANNFTYNFTSNASSSATGGGAAVTIQIEIPIGVELGSFGYGWGVGGWGLGTWGTARSTSTIVIEPRVWGLDHFGKFLVATYNVGSIYQFDPTQVQPWPRAQIIATSPSDCRSLFVTPENFVIALRQNMVVQGCSQGDFNTWTPSTNNTAFIRTLAIGTKLVGGKVLAPFLSLIWSDSAIYLLQYTGSAFVYNTLLIASKCGLIGPGAAITVGGKAYWMSPDNFWMYDGTAQVMPNVEDIRRFVFDQLNINNSYQCTATYNPIHDELEFFYTVIGQTNPTKSVTYSIKDQAWAPHDWGAVGLPARASGGSFEQGDTRPVLAGTDGFLYQHESGVDAAGAALPYSWQIARYALGDNSRMISEVQGIETDFNKMAQTMTITIASYDRLFDGAVQTEPLETDSQVITTSEGYLDFRITGRYIQLLGASTDVGSNFRFGKPAAFLMPVGTRT